MRILEGILRARWLRADGREYALTAAGEKELTALGLDLPALLRSRRVLARACVDLTQRRAHLGGALGDALLGLYAARGWILRHRRPRVVSVTPKGEEKLRSLFGA